MRLCESPGQFLTPHFTFPFATLPASSPPSSSSLVVVDALASAELLLSRVGTSRRGASVSFGRGSGREGGVATMISRTRWALLGSKTMEGICQNKFVNLPLIIMFHFRATNSISNTACSLLELEDSLLSYSNR